jgi:nucleoside-diphosphate-sugar epimerase
MKTVLILGGSYFCGRVCIETLSRLEGFHISVFNRGNIPIGMAGISEHRGNREIAWDISENLPVMHWDVVVDFCAYHPDHVNGIFDHLKGTFDHYILISTTSVYAENSEVPLKENAAKVQSPQYELGEFADYGLNKWLAECALKQSCASRKLPCTILRPAIIYGRYNYAPRESYFFDSIIDTNAVIVPECARAKFSFVWVDDVAQIILRSINNPNVFDKVYNLAGPETVSYTEFVSILESVCEQSFKVTPMPLNQIIRKQLPLPFPPDTNLLYDGSAIQQDIEFEYTPLVQAMSHTWRHYRSFVQRKRQQQEKKL